MSCFCPGHSTFFSSPHDSATKFFAPAPGRCRPAGSRRGCGCAPPRAVGRRGGAAGGAPARAACAEACRASRRARRCDRVCRATLARLPMRRVAPAPATVLLELDSVGRVPLPLLGLVVPSLAFGAGERDRDSYSGLGCHFFLRRVRAIAAGGLEPPTSAL